MTGCGCGAAGCTLLASSHSSGSYFAGWVLLGLGMRLALFDAAFAALALGTGGSLAGAAAFAFCYGAGNGMATITRGAMPLLLFDTARYGRIVGGILRPAFVLSAAAPVAVALALQHWGQAGTLGLGLLTSALLLAAAFGLALRHGRRLRAAAALRARP